MLDKETHKKPFPLLDSVNTDKCFKVLQKLQVKIQSRVRVSIQSRARAFPTQTIFDKMISLNVTEHCPTCIGTCWVLHKILANYHGSNPSPHFRFSFPQHHYQLSLYHSFTAIRCAQWRPQHCMELHFFSSSTHESCTCIFVLRRRVSELHNVYSNSPTPKQVCLHIVWNYLSSITK